MNKVEKVIVKWTDGTNYLARDFSEEELDWVGSHSHHFWKNLNVVPRNMKNHAKIVIAEDVKTKIEEAIENKLKER
jgi:hypothetical protein